MGDIIDHIAGYYGDLIRAMFSSSFATTSQTIIVTIFWLVAVGGMIQVFRKHAEEHNDSLSKLFSSFIRSCYRTIIIWFFVGAAPTMVFALGKRVSTMLQDQPKAIASATGPVLDQVWDSMRMGWYAQTNIQSNLAADNPALLDGGQTGASMLGDANQVAAVLQKIKGAATERIQAQIQQGKALQQSKSPQDQQRGRDMVAQAQDAKRKIDTAKDLNEVQQQFAMATATDEASLSGQIGSMLRTALGVVTLGADPLASLVKRLACAAVALFMSAPFLLLGLMAIWKIIQTFIAMCSHLALYVVLAALSAAFSVAIVPLSMLTFFSTSPGLRKYGDAIVTYWVSMVGATVVLAVAIKTVVVPMITSLGVAMVQAGGTWFSKIVVTHGIGEGFMISLLAGVSFMALGMVFDFFSQFVQKAPQAAIGPLTGTFHP